MRATFERLFPSLPDATLTQLCALVLRPSVGKNSALMRQGELWDKAFIIESGILRMAFTRRDGRELNQNVRHAAIFTLFFGGAVVRWQA